MRVRYTNGVDDETQGYVDLMDVISDIDLALCDSPIHDFGNCPIEKQRDGDCKGCTFYNDLDKS